MDARIVDGRKIARVTDDGKLKVLVHGRDGDDLVPVKVSEDGYLMLAPVTLSGSDVALPVDLQYHNIGDSDPIPVQPSIRPVEEIVVYNAYEIRNTDDTGLHLTPEFDVSRYGRISIYASNTHDQPISIKVGGWGLVYGIRVTQVWDAIAEEWVGAEVSVPGTPGPGAAQWYALHTVPAMRDICASPLQKIRFHAVATTAPTEGNLNVVIWGVPNGST